MSKTPTVAFEEELSRTFRKLRGAFQELFASAEADPLSPYPLSKRLSLDKSLVWKACKILQTEDAASGVPYVPGRAGLKILLDGFSKAGCTEEVIEPVYAAAQALESLIKDHSGDRATLALMLDGMRKQETLEASRKLSFRGNSGVWGVQARVRYSAYFLAPNSANHDAVDVATISGFQRLQRLRSDLAWPLLKMHSFRASDSDRESSSREPLVELQEGQDGLPFLPQFCSTPLPALRRLERNESVIYELLPGAVGKRGAIDLFFGDVNRALGSRWRDTEQDFVEMRSEIRIPAEHMQLDLFAHESLVFSDEPKFQLAGNLFGEMPPPGDGAGIHDIPTDVRVARLGLGASESSSPHLPIGRKLVALAFKQLHWDPSEFRCYRASLDFPPLPTTALMRFRVPARPSQSQ